MTWAILILPGLIVAYALFLRPVLRALPAFKEFYAHADGFWAKVWALCGKSATLAFAYFIQALSWVLQWIDPVAAFFGDPDMRQQLTENALRGAKSIEYRLTSDCRDGGRLDLDPDDTSFP